MQLPRVPKSEASDDVARLYERFAETLGVAELPEAFGAYGNVEPFLKDLFMNVKKFVAGDGKLDNKTRSMIGLATAAHAKNGPWVDLFSARLDGMGVDQKTRAEVLAVAATNYMYNTFFKFRDIAGTDRFEGMSVGLRAHTFHGTSLSDQTIELIDIAVSDINACKPCVSGHVKKAKALGLSDEQVLEAIQCAATVYAGAMFLNHAGF